MRPTRRQCLMTGAAGAAATAAPAAVFARRAPTDLHVVLAGDSIFDNAVYVPGKPSVIEQLVAELGDRGRAKLLARDGDVTRDVKDQLEGLPADATHVVVSVGGNDALQHIDLLDKPVESAAALLGELATAHATFRASYTAMLDALRRCGLPALVCTVYDSNFGPPRKRLADVALTVFNDVILRCAGAAGVPVLDLRRIFTAPADYANPIEPSDRGGAKLVAAIVTALDEHDFARTRTTVYP